jgi:tetratricopeptide (TPR) repeat protein
MLLITLAELELRAGRVAEGRSVLQRVLAADKAFATRIKELGMAVLEQEPDGGFVCFDVVGEAATRDEQWIEAADAMQQFLVEAPFHVAAALKLVEICIDGGLEGRMYAAQARLADAYLAAGKGIEAKLIAQDLLEQEPGLSAHMDRLRRAESLLRDQHESLTRATPGGTARDETPAGAAPEPNARNTAPMQPEAEIDLSEALDADDAGGQADCIQLPDVSTDVSLDEAFRAFREEVWRDSSDEAADQQYKLALAYREMDMLEEAVAALELAARSPVRRFEAASLLGRLYRDMGLLGEAVDWMERAAEAPPPGADEGRKLLYDLGDALDQLGETERALAVFLELQAEAGAYGDVAARVTRLSSS